MVIAAFGGSAPWLLVEGLLCRAFHWTLTELRAQPAKDTLQMWNALQSYDKAISLRTTI